MQTYLIILSKVRFFERNLLNAVIQIFPEDRLKAVTRSVGNDMDFVDDLAADALLIDFQFDLFGSRHILVDFLLEMQLFIWVALI